jgi:hypothetical protein
MCTCNGSARERRPRTSVHPVSLSIGREADVREPEPCAANTCSRRSSAFGGLVLCPSSY